ncbi:hypothetical protein [Aneurinibacillus terranovensis]|uniref:GHMP family kinase ATP-binding protein n=1 Tax=Aneurinibacillus terranovensis TaxID=278991 RepID=UPI00041C4530|nr:hypothetical protein [Aneurinibacillus terranovensis]
MRIGTGMACHTFGELVQGQVNRVPFLISLPIESYVKAAFYPDLAEELLTPPGKAKVRHIIRRMLEENGLPVRGRLDIEQPLPEGKGFATSTADMLAACRAVANAYGVTLPPAYLSRLLARLEPTDGIMYDEIVAYYHRRGRLLDRIGHLPPMKIIGIDRGGKIDTVSFNNQIITYSFEQEKEYACLLKRLKRAVKEGDAPTIGQIATRSAEMHQIHLPHPFFSELVALSEEVQGLGVVVAHSGTLAGILLDAASEAIREQADYIAGKMASVKRKTYRFTVRRLAERNLTYDTTISYDEHIPFSHLAGSDNDP